MHKTLPSEKKRAKNQKTHTKSKKSSMSKHYEESSIIKPPKSKHQQNKSKTFDQKIRNDFSTKTTSPNKKAKKKNPSFFKKQSIVSENKLASIMKSFNFDKKTTKKNDKSFQLVHRHLISSGSDDFSQFQEFFINRSNFFVFRGELSRNDSIQKLIDFTVSNFFNDFDFFASDTQDPDRKKNENDLTRYIKTAYNRNAMTILTINKHHKDKEIFQKINVSDIIVVRTLYQQFFDSKKNLHLNAIFFF